MSVRAHVCMHYYITITNCTWSNPLPYRLYLVLYSSDISLGAPVHGGREVSDGGRNKQLPRLPLRVHTVAIVHLGKLSTVLGRRRKQSVSNQSIMVL